MGRLRRAAQRNLPRRAPGEHGRLRTIFLLRFHTLSLLQWDPRNAAAFIRHNRAAGYRIWGYELGNEPAVWNYTWRTPIITPQQHAADYLALRTVLEREYGEEQRPRVVGPDTTWGSVGDEKPDGGRNPIPGSGGPNYNYWNATLQAEPALDVAALHYYAIQPGLIQVRHTTIM